MDINMPDADQVDQPNQIDPPEEPDETQGPEPDPNRLFKGDRKDYETHTLIVLDATEILPAHAHEENESVHKRYCHSIETTIRAISSFRIVKIRTNPDATEADFKQVIENLLAQKTKKDFLMWYYHGSAGGVDRNYKLRFESGPHGGINGYDFIDTLCNARPDSLLLLDCYVHDKPADMWPLHTGNVEIIALSKIQDVAGRLTHAHEGYVTEAVCRNLRNYHSNVMNDKFLRRNPDPKPRTIPELWAKDYIIKSKTRRIDFSRSGKGKKELCLRFRMDPMRIKQSGEISFTAYCKGPERPSPIEILPAQERGEDEGVADMDDAAQDVLDAENGDGAGAGVGGNAAGNGDGADDGNGLFVN